MLTQSGHSVNAMASIALSRLFVLLLLACPIPRPLVRAFRRPGLDALADQIALQKKERTVRAYFLLDSLGEAALTS
jgi:hypothetical protein